MIRERIMAGQLEQGITILRGVPGSDARLWKVRSVTTDRLSGRLLVGVDACDQSVDPIPRSVLIGVGDDVTVVAFHLCACGNPADLTVDTPGGDEATTDKCFNCAIAAQDVTDEELFGGDYADEFTEWLADERNDVDGDELRYERLRRDTA